MRIESLRHPHSDFNKNPDPGAAELIAAGSILGGWTINLPCGAAEFIFPAIGELYVRLSEMSRDERENLDKWLAVESAIDRSTDRAAVDGLIVEIETASHGSADEVAAAVRYVHDGYLRRCLEDLFAEARFMLAYDRRPGVVIGHCMKALATLRDVETVRIIAPSNEWRIRRYSRRIDAARSIQAAALPEVSA